MVKRSFVVPKPQRSFSDCLYARVRNKLRHYSTGEFIPYIFSLIGREGVGIVFDQKFKSLAITWPSDLNEAHLAGFFSLSEYLNERWRQLRDDFVKLRYYWLDRFNGQQCFFWNHAVVADKKAPAARGSAPVDYLNTRTTVRLICCHDFELTMVVTNRARIRNFALIVVISG